MSIALLTALALFSGPQSAPPTTTPQATPVPPAIAPAGELVCRQQASPGSRRRERVCHTQAQWDEIRRNARSNRDQASRNQRQY